VSTGIRRLEPPLLFAGKDDPNTVSRVPMVSSKLNSAQREALLEARELLSNYIKFALCGWLQSLKQAVGPFRDRFTKTRIKTAKNAGSSRSTVRSTLMIITLISLPPIPLSNYSDCGPDKRENKGQRVEVYGLNG
jgi:hypothetical protein